MAAPTVPVERIATLSARAGEAWWWFGGLALIKVASNQTEGKYSLIEILWPPNLEVPLHVHTREDELFYVLEGKIAYLYLRFTASLTVAAQDSRPSGSLLLSRKALSSSTFMPVYPGAHKSRLRSLSWQKANQKRKVAITPCYQYLWNSQRLNGVPA